MLGRKRKIFVVDDHPLVRKGFVYLVAREPDLEVSGEADSVEKALDRIRTEPPDLVITDISLNGASGLELISSLKSWMPAIPVLVVSIHDEGLYAWRSFKAGARGYVVKRHSEDVILGAIRKVIDGGVYLSEKMTEFVVMKMQGRAGEISMDPLEKLTDRELEVFVLSGHGLTSREIGELIHISTKTVDTHRAKVRSKLNLSSNAEMIQFSVKWIQGRVTAM